MKVEPYAGLWRIETPGGGVMVQRVEMRLFLDEETFITVQIEPGANFRADLHDTDGSYTALQPFLMERREGVA
jgi:hypothetical protein